MAKYQLGIIYILREEFQVFAPGLASILEFRFVPEIVRDLDVTNKDLFFNLLKIFISNNNIPKTSFIIVISDSASIIKDFSFPPKTEQSAEQTAQIRRQAEEFLEHIPFDEVVSKSITIDNGIRVYGTNKDLYESIKEGFVREGFEVICALPAIVMGVEVSTKIALDTDAISSVVKKFPLMREYNLLKQPMPVVQSEEAPTESADVVRPEKKSNIKRIIILTVIFAVLIVVLILVYLNQPK